MKSELVSDLYLSRAPKFIYSAAQSVLRSSMSMLQDLQENVTVKKQVRLPSGYRPGTDEEFMNPIMVEYFRQRLVQWKEELLRESTETIQHLQQGSVPEADVADRASLETERSLELRTRDRERKLISKINAALERIADGTYGYCEETAEPISLQRLEARPIATLSIEAQERHERMERTHRDE